MFIEADFKKSFKIVKRDLVGLVSFYESIKHSQGIEQALTRLNSKEIMRKWSMDLLLMLIFSAAGQRQQVYTTLQCPDVNELAEMQEQAERIYFLQMRTTVEKTKRKNDLPNVLVHESALKYKAFHQEVTQKLNVRRTEVDKTCDHSKPVCMHTETEDFLPTAQVTCVLKNFIKYHFPDLRNITMMSLCILRHESVPSRSVLGRQHNRLVLTQNGSGSIKINVRA